MAVSHPIFARMYDRLSQKMEPEGMSGHRARLVEGLHGWVVEVGAGNGLSFSHCRFFVPSQPHALGTAHVIAEGRAQP